MFYHEKEMDWLEEALRELGIEVEALPFELGIGPREDISRHLQREMGLLYRRHAFIDQYSFAVPSREALAAIARFSPLIEIGAGTGYWAKLLRKAGADVLAFDLAPPALGSSNPHGWTWTHTEVLPGGTEKLLEHPDRTLFLCWPPYASAMAARCLELYQGEHLVYIGEGVSGCTGDDRFHELLERAWVCIETVDIPHWPSVHDQLEVYQRNEKMVVQAAKPIRHRKEVSNDQL